MIYLYYSCIDFPKRCHSCHNDDEDGYGPMPTTLWNGIQIDHCCGVTDDQAIEFAKGWLEENKEILE